MDKATKYKKLLSLISISFFTFTVYAQTGIISGNVADTKYKEPLIGTTVMIEGATIGAVTDREGNFRIENVQPGKYAVSVSYVSYEKQTIADVTVVAGQETPLTILLLDAGLQLRNVTVVAQRKLGTEMAVLNTVRNSLPVVSGISSQQISKTQDSNAAEVLRRVPGTTILDERFVVVRGLAQRYNNVWLNNATIPTSETDSRAFSFDVLPSSLIDNMMVYKSPSAELPADFSGGFVKVLTKNIPDGNTFDIAYQIGFNPHSSFRDFQLTKGYASDYFAFGAGGRKLSGNFPSHLKDVPVSDAAEFTQKENKGWGIKYFTALPEQKLTLVMNRVCEWNDFKIGNITNLNYSTGYDYYETSNNNFLSYDLAGNQSSYRFRYDDMQYKNTVKWGALFNWSLLKGNNKYEFRNFFNQRGTTSLSQRQGTDYYSDENIRKWESLYTSRTTYSGQISGEHRVKENAGKLDWTVGYAFAKYDEPDRKDVKLIEREKNGEKGYYVSDPTRYYQELRDHGISVALNYEHTVTVSDMFSPVLLAGMYGEYKDRGFNARRFVYNLLGSGYDRYAEWDYRSLFSDGNIAADKIYMKESTNKSDSYTSGNQVGAAYVSTQLNCGDNLDANVGIRMEYYTLRLDGYEADGIKPVRMDEHFVDFFPSLNVSYKLNDKHQIRAAYGRSVNRAEFREIVPYVYYDFMLNANISGNVDLKNAYANNVDIRYEFYPSQGETLTVGAFYKNFSNPIEQTFNEAGSGLQYTFHNAGQAKAIGVEMDIKKQLDFIGMKDFGFVFNGAYIYSKVEFEEGSFERNRPMQGQSPYLVNAGLFYQQDESGFFASLLYNRIGKRIETVGIPKQNPNDDIPDIYEMPRNSLDLSFSKRFGKYVEVKGGVKDLLNAKTEYKQFLTLTESSGEKREVEQLIRSFRPGITVNIGVTVKF
ncbi:MAG: TonB-dependent receptor [Tannerellaceae bacterium]|jgi:outer membrane receptor protein involved in Fe transport|nr:TonB-dependent receptor [Tannerellaceae bacterium]